MLISDGLVTDYLEIGHPAHRGDVGGMVVIIVARALVTTRTGQTPPAPGLSLALARAEM